MEWRQMDKNSLKDFIGFVDSRTDKEVHPGLNGQVKLLVSMFQKEVDDKNFLINDDLECYIENDQIIFNHKLNGEIRLSKKRSEKFLDFLSQMEIVR